MHLLSNLMENRSYTEVKREAQDRAGWRVTTTSYYYYYNHFTALCPGLPG